MMWKRMMMIDGGATCSPEVFSEPQYTSSVANYVAHMPTSCRAWFFFLPRPNRSRGEARDQKIAAMDPQIRPTHTQFIKSIVVYHPATFKVDVPQAEASRAQCLNTRYCDMLAVQKVDVPQVLGNSCSMPEGLRQ